MKPGPLPEGIGDAWQSWPTLEKLHLETGLRIAELRKKLREVPCYRCPDKSVHYDPTAATAAVYVVDDDDDDEAIRDEIGAELAGVDSQVAVYALLCRELIRTQREERKDRAELVRCMKEPLEKGVELYKQASSLLLERNKHLEGLWDRMVLAIEGLASQQHERAEKTKNAENNRELKKQSFGLVKEQLPTLLQKWQLTAEASLALEFLAGLQPELIDGVIASGALDPEQASQLTKLRDMLAKKRKAAEEAEAAEQKKNAESQAKGPGVVDTQGEEKPPEAEPAVA